MNFPLKRLQVLTLGLTMIMILVGCRGAGSEPTPTPFIEKEGEDPFIGIPNPASFYCQEMGYQLEMRETEAGTEGICIFPDGKECEEWVFLSGSCAIEWTFCQRQGSNIRAGENIGTCEFADGSSCPEYAYFIGECQAPQ
jgi:putative hemolysin